MSLANFFNRAINEVQIANLDATNLQINNVPFSGAGGGGGYDITSSDSSITLTSQSSGTIMDLTEAGNKWSTFSATSDVTLANNNVKNVSSLGFTNDMATFYYSAPSVAVSVGGGASGILYDTRYNKPALSDILSVNSGNASGGSMSNVGTIGCSNLTVSNSTGLITVTNTTSNTNGQVYSTLNPPPGSVGSAHYYNQLYVVPTQINLVPFVSTALSNTYFKLYTIPISNYPSCVHYVVNVSQIDFYLRSGSSTGTASMTMYLLDKTDLTSITQADLNKSTQAYAINPFTFTSGQTYNMNTAFTLEYQSETVPSALQIVFACNTPSITINRYGLYMAMVADTVPYTTLAEVTT